MPVAIAASMSPLVTRPSLPDAGDARRVDAALGGEMRATAGTVSFAPRTGRTAAGRRGGSRSSVGAAGGAAPPSGAAFGASAGAGAAAAAPPSTIEPSTAPGATVSPSLARISPSTPAAGALTSSVTLSVSSSTSGSSAFTASPGFLNHWPMVASETDSPSVGTRISVAMVLAFSCWSALPSGAPDGPCPVTPRRPRRGRPAAARCASTSGRSRSRPRPAGPT